MLCIAFNISAPNNAMYAAQKNGGIQTHMHGRNAEKKMNVHNMSAGSNHRTVTL